MEVLKTELVDITLIHEHPDNPRQGDMQTIVDSLRVNGQYAPIGVQQSTGYVVYGNHRLQGARDVLGWTQMLVSWIDCDDDEATRILLVDNRTSDLGKTDQRDLAEILGSVPTFEGTGYKPDDLEKLLERINPTPDMPSFDDDEDDDGGAYKLAFESIEERQQWTDLLKELAERLPELPLASTRLIHALQDWLVVRSAEGE